MKQRQKGVFLKKAYFSSTLHTSSPHAHLQTNTHAHASSPIFTFPAALSWLSLTQRLFLHVQTETKIFTFVQANITSHWTNPPLTQSPLVFLILFYFEFNLFWLFKARFGWSQTQIPFRLFIYDTKAGDWPSKVRDLRQSMGEALLHAELQAQEQRS